jgi:uncharacterized protein (DUF697 family)
MQRGSASYRKEYEVVSHEVERTVGEVTMAPVEVRGVAAPVVWLLGKVQSGKSSIVRALTGCSDVEIGVGFKACTKSAFVFDFPDGAPLIRFLDTRGLGEVQYDPAPDIAIAEKQSHILLVVMRSLDLQQSAVLDVVKTVLQRHPDWPVLVAQTTLHEGYDRSAGHITPYPFGEPDLEKWRAAGVPDDLARSLHCQRNLFNAVPKPSRIKFVPIDFTRPDAGFEPLNYGFQELILALRDCGSASVSASIRNTVQSANGKIADRLASRILKYSAIAAAADVVPMAGAVAVPSIQASLLREMAAAYEIPWDQQTVVQFGACLGTGTLVRMVSTFGIRELVKLLPVYGQTAGAAAAAAGSFATTFAVGSAAVYFLGQRKLGEAEPKGVSQIYKDALKQAFDRARSRLPDALRTDHKV